MEMTTIILFAVLIILALFFFFWVIRSMLRAACPQCLQDGDPEMVIPLLPGIRWFCPACGGSFRNKEVLQAGRELAEEDEGDEEEPEEENEEE
jgi:hypothetical protein